MIGQTISHYKILEKLGEGGMGVVYKAQDTKLDRIVALKFLPNYLTSDDAERERFYHEARAASALNHPNITTIYEIGQAGDKLFIAMEYVEGKTLKKLIEQDTFPITKVLEIAIQTCDGLAAAAEKGVVHRDIKSDNIMVTHKVQVKITDFGLAKLKGASRLTKAGSTLGTAAYMSPEQARGEDTDHRSDIFSFGVVLYEHFTGRLPFRGEHHAALMYSLMNEDPPPIARFNDKVTPELKRIVSKALAKDKEDRYQHIDELAADLRRERKQIEYARTGYVRTSTIPPAAELTQPKKNLLKFAIPAVGVIVIVVLLLVFNPFNFQVSMQKSVATEKNSLAVMYFENIPDPDDKDHTGEMLTNLLITSLSQAKGLEVISRERLQDIQKEMGQGDAKTISSSLASQVAKKAGVTTMLVGSILQKDPKLAITTRLIEVQSGKILSSQRLTNFSADQIFTLVDTLALLIRNDLNITPSSPAETKSVADVTTKSPEAYRSYLEGAELYRRYYTSEAQAAYERAIELDSNFAMAYYRLAFANSRLGDNVGWRKSFEKALQLSNRATEKERWEIQAAYFDRIKSNPSKAAELYEELLKKYPHEQGAYGSLWITYMRLMEYDKGIKTLLTGLKNDSLDKSLWNYLGYAYAAVNQKGKALEAVDRYQKLAPAEPDPYDSKGEIYFMFGEVDSALYWLRKALSLRATFESIQRLGFSAILVGDYPTAEKYFQQYGSTVNKSQKARAETYLSLLPMHQGRLKYARQQLLDALSSHQAQNLQGQVADDYWLLTLLSYGQGDYSSMVEYAQKRSDELRKDPSDLIYGRDLLAWAKLKNGSPKIAYKILDELRQEISGKVPVWQAQYDYAVALLAFEEGKYDAAVQQFKKAFQRVFPNRPPQLQYGASLLKTGKVPEAIEELQRVTWWFEISFPQRAFLLLPTRLDWPIASVKAHYWLGVAYEQQGDKQKAIKEYETFLDIWKDADTITKEMQDAKARLEKLKRVAAK